VAESYTRPLALGLPAAWDIITSAQGRPGILKTTGEPSGPVARTFWSVSGERAGGLAGFLQVVDADYDLLAASVSFNVADRLVGRTTRIRFRITFVGGENSCTMRVEHDNDPECSAIVREIAEGIAVGIEARAPVSPADRPSRIPYGGAVAWSLGAAVAFVVGAIFVRRWLWASGERRRTGSHQ
jgi:hypothetical protein